MAGAQGTSRSGVKGGGDLSAMRGGSEVVQEPNPGQTSSPEGKKQGRRVAAPWGEREIGASE